MEINFCTRIHSSTATRSTFSAFHDTRNLRRAPLYVDSVVVVTELAKGQGKQTKKLVKLSRMWNIPIVGFMKKLDRKGGTGTGINKSRQFCQDHVAGF